MRHLRRLLPALAGMLALSLAAPAAGQAEQSLGVSEVNVTRYPRVTMVVELRNVEDLDPSLLQVTENGSPVTDLTVGTIDESAVEVGIVLAIDTSGSMQGDPIEAAVSAAGSFVAQMRNQDRVAVVGFGDEARVYSPFTNSQRVLATALDQIAATGETAFYDGVVRSAELFTGEAAKLERNLIVLSDGRDTVSTATLEEAIATLQEQGVRVFGVALNSPDFDPGPLQQVVASTDGLYLETTEPSELSELYGRIQRELDNRLVVRFTATQQAAGDVAFGVRYGDLAASQSVSVPGFATTLPSGGGTFPEPEVIQVASRAPVDATSLLLVSVGATGLAVVLLVFIMGGPAGDRGSQLKDRLRAYAKGPKVVETKPGLLGRIPLLRRFSEGAEAMAKRKGLLGALNAALEQADIPLRAGEAVAGALALAVISGLLTGLLSGSPLLGLVALAVGFVVVAGIVQWLGSRERRRFEDQLPDTLTLLATSLRAGYSLLQAVEAVAEEAPAPTSREFARAIAESRLGRQVVDAMEGIAGRMVSEDFRWAVMAIEIQREVGGNLAEVLSIVADTMRQRNRLKGEIKALTAEGRISAIVLASLPFGLFMFLFASNRDYLNPLLTRTVGLAAMAAGVVLITVGVLWMKKIIDIEV